MSTPSSPPRSAAELPLWRIITEAVRSAPARARRVLFASLLPLGLAAVAGVLDLRSGTDELELLRMAGLLLTGVGYALLVGAYLLHNVSQQQAACAPSLRLSFTWQLKSEVMDRIFLALPGMALGAACLFALAIGLYVPSVVRRPFILVMLAVLAWCLWLSARTAVHATRFLYTHAERQAEQANRARSEAAEARLEALSAQLNPHFLFNALNTVAALVRGNPKAAERTVEDLSEVLRRTLARSATVAGTVEEEIDYIRAYLAVEQERWGDRLRVEWDVAPETRALSLSPLILQPLVENALKHGLGGRLEGGRLRIQVAARNRTLELVVADDGVGFPARWVEGTGLGNLRRRLETLFGELARVSVEAQEAGALVRVTLPASPATAAGTGGGIPAPGARARPEVDVAD